MLQQIEGMQMGPSPRWRGNPACIAGGRPHAGTIPALAGEPVHIADRLGQPKDHPRAGGGTRCRHPPWVVSRGPSPRWRGNLAVLQPRIDNHGTIPALAGEPCVSGSSRTWKRDHPRAGGGTVAGPRTSGGAEGPSPRWRGNPRSRPPRRSLPGTIPALAGEPPLPSASIISTRDHPRAGGGTVSVFPLRVRVMGPSPRWRGNRDGSQHLRLWRGTIPALAGEPDEHGSKTQSGRDHPRAGGGTCDSRPPFDW